MDQYDLRPYTSSDAQAVVDVINADSMKTVGFPRAAVDAVGNIWAFKYVPFTNEKIVVVNAQGQIRGSTYPSKVAHLWVHLHRDLTADAVFERNLTYLTIKKNRYTGQTGPAGVLQFNPETYKLSELLQGELPT